MIRVNLFPSLCGSRENPFRTTQELADAGCMSRTRAYQCLYGFKEFTKNEKQAILNAIAIKEAKITVPDDFDERFRRKVGNR